MTNGKLTDIVIEDSFFTDERTGMQKFCYLDVYADADSLPLILAVEGVSAAHKSCSLKNNFSVFLDPRYDREYVKAEIEAAIKIGKQDN